MLSSSISTYVSYFSIFHTAFPLSSCYPRLILSKLKYFFLGRNYMSKFQQYLPQSLPCLLQSAQPQPWSQEQFILYYARSFPLTNLLNCKIRPLVQRRWKIWFNNASPICLLIMIPFLHTFWLPLSFSCHNFRCV